MDAFDRAFENFKATGRFMLNNAPLIFSQLCSFERYVNDNLDLNARFNPFSETSYQFHLNKVELVSGNTADFILTGAINEHTIGYNANFSDVNIVRLGTKPREHIALRTTEKENNLKRQQAVFEKLLLTLLCENDHWHVIKLGQVKFSPRQGIYKPLSENFFSQLLEGLTQHTDMLKDLSLASPAYSDHSSLIDFLNTHNNLETLHVELDDSPGFIEDLTKAIAKHPRLKLLDLGQMQLNSVDYHALSGLLDKNYHIKVLLSEPANPALLKRHNELMQRIAKPGLERFKEELLTQDKLIEMATNALMEGDKERFNRLLNWRTELPAITSHGELEEAYKSFPVVYSTHADYIKHYASDCQLDLHKPLVQGKSKTMGYHLLETAFAAEDGESIVRLLKAGANLLERTEQGNTLLSPLSVGFQDTECPDWKKTLINYFQQDLSILIPASRHLVPFESVYSPLNRIKKLLDRYLTKLRKRTDWPYFLQLISGVSLLLRDRKNEWKRALESLADAVDASTERGAEIDYAAMDVFHQGIKRLVADADTARRGLLGRSELNDTLKQLGTELISEIEKCKVELHVKEVEQGEQRGAQKQEDRIKQLQETILSAKKERSKDKEEMEEKLSKQEEKINQLLQSIERMKNNFSSNQSKETTSEKKPTQQEETQFFFKR